MEAGQILSNQITSSSNLAGTQANDGRLNHPGPGWCAATQDELQYLQIDLLTQHVIKAVIDFPCILIASVMVMLDAIFLTL